MEYGAMLPGSKVVYLKSRSLETITAWIAEYSTVTPLELVTRVNVGDISGRWQ